MTLDFFKDMRTSVPDRGCCEFYVHFLDIDAGDAEARRPRRGTWLHATNRRNFIMQASRVNKWPVRRLLWRRMAGRARDG
jgi:hypothetical protein